MEQSGTLYIKLGKLVNRINENSKKPKDFGTGVLLYTSEIHMIDAIGLGEGVNGSSLSEKTGITNGGVTQIAAKLLAKGMIVKSKKSGNQKEVFMTLTELGKIAYKNHFELHRTLSEKISQVYEEMSEDQRSGIMTFLKVVEENTPKF